MSGDEPLVLVEPLQRAATLLTLNRPAKRNALSAALMDALCAAIDRIEADPRQRVLILRGAGPVFCAGLDLQEAADAAQAEASARRVATTLQRLHQSRLVTIATIHGAALAGGAGLATACDLVVMAEDAIIGYPEVRRGLVAGLVLSYLLSQVSHRHALELQLTAEPIDAHRAYAMGLVNRVAPATSLLAVARELANQVLHGGPEAIVRTKRVIDELSGVDWARAFAIAHEHHMAARSSAEAKEGLAAFVAKRSPRWVMEEGEEDPP